MEIIINYLLGCYLLALIIFLFLYCSAESLGIKVEKGTWYGVLLYFILAPIYFPIWVACVIYYLIKK